jgi:predicted GIY-YIG superfamily endonuclease
MSALVYLATNLINGKRYVGLTKESLRRRRTKHFAQTRFGRKTRICSALRKYGFDMFRWTVLSTWPTIEEAAREEIRLIALWKPEYNVSAGGDLGPTAVSWSKIQRKVICLDDGEIYDSVVNCARAYGVGHSNISTVCSGRKCATLKGRHFVYYDKPLSEIERAALISHIDARSAARVAAARAKRRRQVIGPDGTIYPSRRAAAAAYGVTPENISWHCHAPGVINRRFSNYQPHTHGALQ